MTVVIIIIITINPQQAGTTAVQSARHTPHTSTLPARDPAVTRVTAGSVNGVGAVLFRAPRRWGTGGLLPHHYRYAAKNPLLSRRHHGHWHLAAALLATHPPLRCCILPVNAISHKLLLNIKHLQVLTLVESYIIADFNYFIKFSSASSCFLHTNTRHQGVPRHAATETQRRKPRLPPLIM